MYYTFLEGNNMSGLKELLQNYNKPLTKEELEKIIYNIFCAAIFLAPVIPELIGYGIYSLKNTIFIFVTIATIISLFIINRKDIKNIKINIYDKLLIAYIILVIFSTIFSKFGIVECILGTNGRGEGLITIFCYIATFIIFSRGYKQMGGMSKIAIIAAVIVSVYSFVQANKLVDMKIWLHTSTAKGIAIGTMGNQNFLSSYICLFLPMSCFYFINVKEKTKAVISLVITAMLFMTQIYAVTLGGYITFAVMGVIIIIYSLLLSKNKKETVLKICILSAILFLIFVVINYEGKEKYTKEVKVSKQEVTNLVEKRDDFGNGRLGIWRGTIDVIKDNVLLGVGPDSLKKADIENESIKNRRVDKAHCEPLQIAVTTGVPSLVIYILVVGQIGIYLLILCIKKGKNLGIKHINTMYTTMVLICFASYLMQSLINISVVQVAPLYWAILGTAAGIIQDEKNII